MAPRAVRARLDEASEQALAVLMNEGRNESEAVLSAPATFRPTVRVAGEATRVLVEQLRAVDLRRLDDHVGRLEPGEQRAVDEALELVLGL